jgi:predicted Ser/Thr protein kinase
MMNMLRRFGNNPANQKKVQISLMSLIGILEFMKKIDVNILTNDEHEAYKFISRELTNKKTKVRNRQTYTAYVHATGDEKQSAFENYLQTKQLGT